MMVAGYQQKQGHQNTARTVAVAAVEQLVVAAAVVVAKIGLTLVEQTLCEFKEKAQKTRE